MLARGTRMYEGFERFEIQTSDPEVKIVGRVGGKGPPLLLTGAYARKW